jgi:hypothetical protein
MVRIFFAFCLSIIPALTSYSASMAQHAAGAAGKIVVCTSLGSSIIYTDIDGQPEAAPLFCPDYIIQLDSITLPAFELHLTARLIFQHQQTTKANAALYAKSRFNELVRAPLFLT